MCAYNRQQIFKRRLVFCHQAASA